ncbi:alpha/beta hydrolase [Paenibacillus sp. EZ-K15]|uniref:alpha/beta hydrolase n=1 Tax=Paenibacillus sp. EZ-K15 TaxID=2044275 RepID=UPI000BF92308|nr:alpha/beta hydrolase [Paenibacillus sp. EZ-K15]
MRTICYKTVEGVELFGDFYSACQTSSSVIVYIHGGGLIWGSRKDILQEQVKQYNQAGLHVLSIDYRLAPETRLPAIIEDIQDALRWLREQAFTELGFQPSAIAVVGSSAGGYLALLAGSREPDLKAVVSFYGYGDIQANWYSSPSSFYLQKPIVPKELADQLITNRTLAESSIQQRFGLYLYYRQQGIWTQEVTGLDLVQDKEKLDLLCPVQVVDDSFPPTMLLHGEDDQDVPCEQSIGMARRLHSAGVEHTLFTLPGEDHLFDMQMDKKNVRQAFAQVLEFLRRHFV